MPPPKHCRDPWILSSELGAELRFRGRKWGLPVLHSEEQGEAELEPKSVFHAVVLLSEGWSLALPLARGPGSPVLSKVSPASPHPPVWEDG